MKYEKNNFIIAIDGPAGSGKSTVAKLLASKLGFLYIDTGAMYRAITLHMIEKRLLDLPEDKLKNYVNKLKINLNEGKKIYLNGKDVSKSIRTSQVTKLVSEISAKEVVREEMVKRQKEFGKNASVVMDGRDIGTKVFPKANLKIYLTASSEIRAKRRINDLKEIGEKASLSEMIQQINDRDNYDSSRKISPLTKAQNAIVIDTSNLTADQTSEKILSFIP